MSVPCREALTGSAHQVKGRERRGPRHQETTMPKYLLLKRRARAPARARRDLPAAATAYAEAAHRATNVAERDHLIPGAPALGPAEL
jgi:hypothetical protein